MEKFQIYTFNHLLDPEAVVGYSDVDIVFPLVGTAPAPAAGAQEEQSAAVGHSEGPPLQAWAAAVLCPTEGAGREQPGRGQPHPHEEAQGGAPLVVCGSPATDHPPPPLSGESAARLGLGRQMGITHSFKTAAHCHHCRCWKFDGGVSSSIPQPSPVS